MSEKREIENIMDFAGDLLSSVFFEKLAHGRIRAGFVTGWTIITISTIGLLIWIHFHPNLTSNVTLAGCCFFFGISVIGAMVQTNTDLEDQEAGRYSKSGSGWNLWGDNYFFNQLARAGQVLCLLLCVGGTFYFSAAASAEGSAVAKKDQAKTAAIATSKSHSARSVAVHHAHSAPSRHSSKH